MPYRGRKFYFRFATAESIPDQIVQAASILAATFDDTSETAPIGRGDSYRNLSIRYALYGMAAVLSKSSVNVADP